MAFTQRSLPKTVFAALLLGLGGWAWWLSSLPKALTLGDGSRVYFHGIVDSRHAPGADQTRDVAVNGEALFEVAAGTGPFRVHTHLLLLTVNGEAAFKVTSYDAKAGGEVQVLRGVVLARKTYRSPSPASETISAGEMVMVNQTIDLLEKEKDDTAETAAWAAKIQSDARP